MPALERELPGWIGGRDAEAGQRLLGRRVELSLAPLIAALQEAREAARPWPVERLAERLRKRRPYFLGRRGSGHFVRIQVGDRRGIRGRREVLLQAASTITVDPWPPPMHAEAKPSFAPRRFIS